MDKILKILEATKQILATISQIKESYEAHALGQTQLEEKLKHYEPMVTNLYNDSIQVDIPPFECKDVSSKFKSVMALAHNCVLPFSEQGIKAWDEQRRFLLLKQAMRDYQHTLLRLEYELEKV